MTQIDSLKSALGRAEVELALKDATILDLRSRVAQAGARVGELERAASERVRKRRR